MATMVDMMEAVAVFQARLGKAGKVGAAAGQGLLELLKRGRVQGKAPSRFATQNRTRGVDLKMGRPDQGRKN